MSILASNIPEKTPIAKIEHFFSFCGKIYRMEKYDLSNAEGEQSVQVFFTNPSAVSTALLLNGAEFEGREIVVREFNDGNIPHEGARVGGAPGEAKARQEGIAPAPGLGGEHDEDDIEQESKPKSAIFAQYLSQGYVLSDQLINKALDYDKKNGYSSKFQQFIGDLDKKYGLSEKQKQLNEQVEATDEKYKVSDKLKWYFEKAKGTGIGSRVHDFYTRGAKEAQEVHAEARRLASEKEAAEAAEAAKAEGPGPASSSVPTGTGSSAPTAT